MDWYVETVNIGVAEAGIEESMLLLIAVSDTTVQELDSNRVEVDSPHWTRVSMR